MTTLRRRPGSPASAELARCRGRSPAAPRRCCCCPMRIETRFADTADGSLVPAAAGLPGHDQRLLLRTRADPGRGRRRRRPTGTWSGGRATRRPTRTPCRRPGGCSPAAYTPAAGGLDRAAAHAHSTSAQQPAAPTPAGQHAVARRLPTRPRPSGPAPMSRRPPAQALPVRLDRRAHRRLGHPPGHRRADHARPGRRASPRTTARCPTGCRSTRACAGWWTSTRRSRPAWACASRSPPTSGRAASTASSCSACATPRPTGPATPAFAALLDAHHYTDGIAFVPQGAPTNNTPDASSAYSRKDPDYAISFAVEREAPLDRRRQTRTGRSPPRCSASRPRPSTTCGTPTATASATAGTCSPRCGRPRSATSWSSCSPRSSAPTASTRRAHYALANAVPRGALPALRAGTTPYGILPVTSLAAYAAPAGEVAVSPDLGGRAGRPPQPPAARLAGEHRGGAAHRREQRPRPGPGAGARHGRQLDGLPRPPGDRRRRDVEPAAVPSDRWPPTNGGRSTWPAAGHCSIELGLTGWDPRVIHTSMGRDSYPVPYPTVQDGALSETAPLTADATPAAGGELHPLAQQRLRHRPAAARITPARSRRRCSTGSCASRCCAATWASRRRPRSSNGTLAASALRETELVNISQAAASVTPVGHPRPPGRAGLRPDLGPVPARPPPAARIAVRPLADLRASLDTLAALPTAELDRLLTETLDACSHRLDVWVSAIANSVLASQRAAQPAEGAPTLAPGRRTAGWRTCRPAPRRGRRSPAPTRRR